MIRYIETEYYTKQMDRMIPRFRTQVKVLRWLAIGLCLPAIAFFILLFEETGNVGQSLAAGAFFPAFCGFMVWLTKIKLSECLHRAKTISLLEDSVEVKNWNGELRQRLSYKDFQYIEVVYLRLPLGVGNYGGHGKLQVICLYTGTNRVQEGGYSEIYSTSKDIIMFPYDAEAWEELLKHIPLEKVKPLEDCTPFNKVKWIKQTDIVWKKNH